MSTDNIRRMADTTGVDLIAAERRRQVDAEGWTPEHDDEHGGGEMAQAAACYASNPHLRHMGTWAWQDGSPPHDWPWASCWWKPSHDDRIRELVKAGALIAAEIDRLQRAKKPTAEDDRAGLVADCARSHPHESMSADCRLRTEVARLRNELEHATAALAAHAEPESTP